MNLRQVSMQTIDDSLTSFYVERALTDAFKHKKAILKFISPNDVGLTGGHQCGFYLPKSIWKDYTSIPPTKEKNEEEPVTIIWQDGRETDSKIKWYGKGTRSEYRLTCFGRDFPWLIHDNVGNLLVLIPTKPKHFLAYVFDKDQDIDEVQATLGVEILQNWTIYTGETKTQEDSDACIDRHFRTFAGELSIFPSTKEFSSQTWAAVEACIADFQNFSTDDKLMKWLELEYQLFQLAERHLCQSEVSRLFASVDDFISVASSIMNRRKSRAGRSLENHVEKILQDAGIPFSMRPTIDGKPDILIPSKEAYKDSSYPVEKLCMLAVKTTCKDRWRQITKEAKRIPQKHLLTIQNGISPNQLREMKEYNVALIVPLKLQKLYPKNIIEIFSVEQFLEKIHRTICHA